MKKIICNIVLGSGINGEIFELESIYRDEDGLSFIGKKYKGIKRSEYEEGVSREGLKRNLFKWWNESRKQGDKRGLEEYVREVYKEKGERAIWDITDEETTKRLREYTGLSEEDCPLFMCIGGGKCINRNIIWERVKDKYILYKIIEHDEDEAVAWEYFLKLGKR